MISSAASATPLYITYDFTGLIFGPRQPVFPVTDRRIGYVYGGGVEWLGVQGRLARIGIEDRIALGYEFDDRGFGPEVLAILQSRAERSAAPAANGAPASISSDVAASSLSPPLA